MIESFLDFINNSGFFYVFKIISLIFSVIVFCFLVYLLLKTMEQAKEYRDRREAHFDIKGDGRSNKESAHDKNNAQWERIRDLFQSDRESDWRIALIDADSMLDQLLIDRGYVGQGVGESLKSVSYGDFPWLDMAWEAHKVRNNIAHMGEAFAISHRQAYRIFKIYERMFFESGHIT